MGGHQGLEKLMGCKVFLRRAANQLSTWVLVNHLEGLSLPRKKGYVWLSLHVSLRYLLGWFCISLSLGLGCRSSQCRVEVPQNGRQHDPIVVYWDIKQYQRKNTWPKPCSDSIWWDDQNILSGTLNHWDSQGPPTKPFLVTSKQYSSSGTGCLAFWVDSLSYYIYNQMALLCMPMPKLARAFADDWVVST